MPETSGKPKSGAGGASIEPPAALKSTPATARAFSFEEER
jgi:hypothetical protein